MFTPAQTLHPAFTHARYTVRRKALSLLGLKFYFEDEAGQPFAFVKRKALAIRESLRMFTGESEQQELLRITARQIIDFGAGYDVVDSTTGQQVGTLKRRGWKSMVRDEWIIMDATGQEIGRIREDSIGRALIRRFVFAVPQSYAFEVNGAEVGTARQNWNFFLPKLFVDFSTAGNTLDPRLGLAAVALLITIEGREGE